MGTPFCQGGGEDMEGTRKIGWIGLGRMGIPMATRLVEAGHAVAVYNRSPDKAAELVKAGARLGSSPKDAASGAEVVFTMIADSIALEAVSLGEYGAVSGLGPSAVLIDMSTVDPASSSKVNQAVEAKGAKYLRAPVTGSTVLAKTGTLGILCSGDRAAYDKVLDVLQVLGNLHFYLGAGEEARYLKIAINMMIGSTIQMFAESLILGKSAGLDWAQMIEVIAGSVAGSRLVQYKAKPVTERNFSPAFTVKMMQKDFDLALTMAQASSVPTPLTSLVRQLYTAAEATGKGDLDFSALILLAEEMAGMKSQAAEKAAAKL
jgi:3-hydroxyisobutyrate dehydrogenase-like beta-hydroxyacid dehydrogenase